VPEHKIHTETAEFVSYGGHIALCHPCLASNLTYCNVSKPSKLPYLESDTLLTLRLQVLMLRCVLSNRFCLLILSFKAFSRFVLLFSSQPWPSSNCALLQLCHPSLHGEMQPASAALQLFCGHSQPSSSRRQSAS